MPNQNTVNRLQIMRHTVVGVLLGGGCLVASTTTPARLFQLPGAAIALRDKARDTAGDAVRDTVRTAGRETAAEVTERASAGVNTALTRAEEAVTEAALTSKIKAKMALDDVVKAADIDIDTDGSVVTLTGTVGSQDEQRRAVRIATETAGVTNVVDRLRVRYARPGACSISMRYLRLRQSNRTASAPSRRPPAVLSHRLRRHRIRNAKHRMAVMTAGRA